MQLNISFFSRRGYRVRLIWPNIWGHNLVSSPNAGMHMGSVASLRSCGHRRHCRTNGWLITCRIILWSSQKGVITPDLPLLPCNVCPLRQRLRHEEWVNLMITPFQLQIRMSDQNQKDSENFMASSVYVTVLSSALTRLHGAWPPQRESRG